MKDLFLNANKRSLGKWIVLITLLLMVAVLPTGTQVGADIPTGPERNINAQNGGGFYDDTSPAIAFIGSWTREPCPDCYDSTRTFTSSTSGVISFDFIGSEVTIYRTMNQNRGIAEIWVDGVQQGEMNNYAATPTFQVPFQITGLDNDYHVLEIHNSDRKDANSTGFLLSLDGIEVVNNGPQPGGRYENGYSSIVYAPGEDASTYFTEINCTFCSGKTGHQTSDTQFGNVQFEFHGSGITVGRLMASNQGKIQVTIYNSGDFGGTEVFSAEVDNFSSSLSYQEEYEITGLTEADYILYIENLNQKNPLSTDYQFTLDYLDVEGPGGAPTPTPIGGIPAITGKATIIDNADKDRITYSGGVWKTAYNTDAYRDSFEYSFDKTAYYSIQFYGNAVGFAYTPAYNRGIWDIYIDGTKYVTLDAYNPLVLTQQTYSILDLPLGDHTLEVRNTPNKNFFATAYILDVDYIMFNTIDLSSSTIYDAPADDASFTYGPSAQRWHNRTCGVNENCYGGQHKYTFDTTAFFELSFTGAAFAMHWQKAYNRGVVEIYVDDIYYGRYDLYDPGIVWDTYYIMGFDYGPHTLRIQNVPVKNPSSTNYIVSFDYIEVFGIPPTSTPADSPTPSQTFTPENTSTITPTYVFNPSATTQPVCVEDWKSLDPRGLNGLFASSADVDAYVSCGNYDNVRPWWNNCTDGDGTPRGTWDNPFTSIRHAMKCVNTGGTIMVMPGIYDESFTVNNDRRGQTIVSYDVEDPSRTVIQATDRYAIWISYVESPVTFWGFSITGATGGPTVGNYDGAVLVMSSNVVLRGNHIFGNVGNNGGSAIDVRGSSTIEVYDNLIYNNTGTSSAIWIQDGGKQFIHDNRIYFNTGGPAIGVLGAGPRLYSNEIYDNTYISERGVAVDFSITTPVTQSYNNAFAGNINTAGPIINFGPGSHVNFHNNVMSNNTSIYVVYGGSDAIHFRNNIISDNVTNGQAIHDCSHIIITHTNLYNNSGGDWRSNNCDFVFNDPARHNVKAWPYFVDESARDFHLRAWSPMLDKGTTTDVNLNEFDKFGNLRVNLDGFGIQDGDWDDLPDVDIGLHEYQKPASPPPFPTDTLQPGDPTATPTPIAITTGIYENDSGYLTYDPLGSFRRISAANASGGNYDITDNLSAKFTFNFYGIDTITVYRTVGPDRGIAEIWIDGVFYSQVDNYSPGLLYQRPYTISGINLDRHTFEWRNSGDKNAASGGYLIDVDRFELYIAPPTPTPGPKEGIYQNTDRAITYSGDWKLLNYPGGNFHWTYKNNDSLYFTFNSAAIKIYRTVAYNRGISEIWIDGEKWGEMDSYDPGVKYQVPFTIGGLENKNHVLEIRNTNRHNPSGTWTILDIDYIEIIDVQYVPTGIYDDLSDDIIFSGKWGRHDNSKVYGGTYTYSSVLGAQAYFYFTGNALTIYRMKAYNRGIAEIWIDGEKWGEMDDYDPGVLFQQPFEISGLSYDNHTLVIKVVLKKNPLSISYYQDIDAIEVRNEAPAEVGRYEETSQYVSTTGTWLSNADCAACSAGGYTSTLDKTARFFFNFKGNRVDIGRVTSSNGSIAEIWIDNVFMGFMDNYSTATEYDNVYTVAGLSDTQHSLVIRNTVNNHPNSTNYVLNIDYVEVSVGVNPPDNYEDNYGVLSYTAEDPDTLVPDWEEVASVRASGGTYHKTNEARPYVDESNPGTRAVAEFSGDVFILYHTVGSDHGIPELWIDGTKQMDLDMYNADFLWKVPAVVTGLGTGAHTFELRNVPEKQSASSDFVASIDSIQSFEHMPLVGSSAGVQAEESAAEIETLKGGWSVLPNASASGGSYLWTPDINAVIRIVFTGSGIDWYGVKGPNRGVYEVYLDGMPYDFDTGKPDVQNLVDGYLSTQSYKEKMGSISGLDTNVHVLELRNTSARNTYASDNVMDLDYVTVFE